MYVISLQCIHCVKKRQTVSCTLVCESGDRVKADQSSFSADLHAVMLRHHCSEYVDPRNSPPDYVRSLRDLQLHPDDVMVTSFPKSGTIWVMTTVAAIMSVDDLEQFEIEGPDFVRLEISIPRFLEVLPSVKRPTVIYSHLRPTMIPKCNKIIQVQRNPKDIAVSFFHFAKMLPSLHSVINDWDFYISNFCHQNNLVYGNWFDYMKDWLPQKNDPNILFIQYEDFVADPHAMIMKLSDFLGKPLTEGQVKRIADLVSFASMSKNPKLSHQLPGAFDQTKSKFLRKGKVGDWRNYFTDKQNKAFDDFYKEFAKENKLDLKFDL